VSIERNQNVQDIPVLVHRPPQVIGLPTDLDEHLVEMPLVPGTGLAAVQPFGEICPNLPHHRRTVSWETTTPRSCIISSTSRKLSGNR
jgi:hypothetical protein